MTSEILATKFINSRGLRYEVAINRLRWKDPRNLAMRRADVIGFAFDQKPLGFLKAEAKSRKHLAENVVVEARKALEKNAGLPLPHTLSFIVQRLFEGNYDEKAQKIEEYVHSKLPDQSQVAHLVFTFSQNDPSSLLEADAKHVKKGSYSSFGRTSS